MTEIYDKARETGGRRLPLFIIAALVLTATASAYVGPGAGFGIVTSFLVFVNAIVVSLLSALLWPVNILLRFLRKRRREHRAMAGRVVILGLDGLSPSIARELMEKGGMPNLRRLSEAGVFTELVTTCPGISPVAWSSFQTGVNPGRHGIFDFLAPDRDRYIPVLSSVETGNAPSRSGIGPFRRTAPKPFIRLLRRSRPFWTLLKRYGLRSTVLRVPITYPPEPLDGHLLSGMCVPDLRGTQGSYTLMTVFEPEDSFTGGVWRKLEPSGAGVWKASIPGPETDRGDSAEVGILLRAAGEGYRLEASGETLELVPGELSRWVELVFRSGGKKVKGITRFCVSESEDGLPSLYASAINVSPLSPSVPISHPVHYCRYLAGLQGPYATLGLAEDTWALSNGALSEEVFLEQAWSIFEERREMFFDALKRNPSGLVTCVFDTSDRIQHMFWADGHQSGTPVHDMYTRMDGLIGETMDELGRKDMLIVMSDHGFTSFHTCVDFNRWLADNGYLVLEEGTEKVETGFKGVDWSRSRAWSMGLSGIMLNLRGRESQGIVEPGDEASALLDEISGKLMQLEDDEGRKVISRVYRADSVYNGPYVSMGPDLVIGTRVGYRSGWSCVTGGVGERTLYPNERHWNGDHCHDHRLVPGTLACSSKLDVKDACILDIAPTALRALGINAPGYMEGRSLLMEAEEG